MTTNAGNIRASKLSHALAIALFIGSGFALTETIVAAQEPAPQPKSSQETAMGQMMKDQSAMMAERGKMMADMKAMDQKLNELVARMNAAQRAEKIDAIAAVVQEFVAQHTRMGDRMMTMQNGMMDRMMSMMMSGPQKN